MLLQHRRHLEPHMTGQQPDCLLPENKNGCTFFNALISPVETESTCTLQPGQVRLYTISPIHGSRSDDTSLAVAWGARRFLDE